MSRSLQLRRSLSVTTITAGLLSLMTGCPGGPAILPLASDVTLLSVTGAVMGGTGRIRVSVGNPVRNNTTVGLASSNPGVATVPASVTIPADATTAEVQYNGVSAGTATITADLGGSAQMAVVRVVDSTQLTSLSGPGATLQTGASASVFVGLNMTTPTEVTVNLSSSDPSVISVPSSITVQEFNSGASAAITAGNAGTATITATLGGVNRSVAINVGSTPSITSLSISSRLQSGAVVSLSV